MSALEKVKCVKSVNCDRKFYVESEDIPSDAQADEAFPCGCPLCEEGLYAVLAKSS